MASTTCCASSVVDYMKKACGAAPKPRVTYRRSHLTRAPRKRSFIAQMTKYNPMESNGAGADWLLRQGAAAGSVAGVQMCCICPPAAATARAAAAQPVSTRKLVLTQATAAATAIPSMGGNDGGSLPPVHMGGNGGNGDDAGSPSRSVSALMLLGLAAAAAVAGCADRLSRAVIPGSAALLLSWAMAPGAANAAVAAANSGLRDAVAHFRQQWVPPTTAGKRSGADGFPSRGASLCLNHPLNQAGGLQVTAAAAAREDAIVYGHVELTAWERRMVANRQLFLRETVRA